jgi:osmoprotectant transport system ATP-binding protein
MDGPNPPHNWSAPGFPRPAADNWMLYNILCSPRKSGDAPLPFGSRLNRQKSVLPAIFALMFSLAAVRKSYNGVPALQDITLVTPPGKTTVLIGPSGCGKSTVFGLMTGLLMPDAGVITFEGEPITPARLPAIRRRIGYVIQDGGLFPHLTAMANVTLMAKHIGWSVQKCRGRVEELSSLARLSPKLLSRYPGELSGGQRQRVALMRALMLDAEVLLLDEPLAALDPMVRAELQDDLAAIFGQVNKTVVLVTHDINEAAFFANQIVLMRAGRIVQTGSADDLFTRPAEPFVSQFVRAQNGHVYVERSR